MSEIKISGNVSVVLENRGHATLRPSNYVTAGGEGLIYRISDTVVKLYRDPAKMIQAGMPDKIKLLSKINHPFISSPKGLVMNQKGDLIGHYLNYVDGHPLSKVFTNDFYKTEGFDSNHASILVDRMKQVVEFAHGAGATLVDPNELNWFTLFSAKNPEPRIIDVDSWSIGKWHSNAVMSSIRDWRTKLNHFDFLTDWFSWAVVTFQVYTGIHPYKGTLDGFDRWDFVARMKANASVFTPGVRLNMAVRDFSCIPSNLLGWYKSVFQNGQRSFPPSPFDTGISTPSVAMALRAVTVSKGGLLVFEKLFERVSDPAVRVFHCGVTLLSSGKVIDLSTKKEISSAKSQNCRVVKVDRGWLLADFDKKDFRLEYVSEISFKSEIVPLKISADKLFSFENRLFVINDRGLSEIKFQIFGSKPIASVGQTWSVMTNSTLWFDGVGIMDALGNIFAVVPFGEDSVKVLAVKELNGLRVVSGKAGHRFFSVIAIDKNGDYQKFEFSFDKEYSTYKSWQGGTDNAEFDLAILPKGVCATIVRDGELNIFVPTTGTINRLEDKKIATDMTLFNWVDKVVYIQNGSVWTLRMK